MPLPYTFPFSLGTPVSIDATVAGGTANSTSGLSYSHTINGSATGLTVEVTGYFNASDGYASLTTHTVTVGSTPLQLIQIINCNNAVGHGWVELWGVISPPTGAQIIQVVENVSSSAAFINVSSTSWFGVAQFGTGVINSGSGTALTSGSMVTITGDMVLSLQGSLDRTLAIGSSGTSLYNGPTATTDYVTMLVQTGTGTSTVALTSTTTTGTWGVVSCNLVAGNIYAVGAAATMTFTSTAAADFVNGVELVNAATMTLTLSSTATASVQALGPALRYVGRPPDTSGTIATAQYLQQDQQAFLVTPTWVTQQITLATANLATQTWINEQVGNYATQAEVQSTLAAYVPTTALGATVGQLGSDGYVPPGVLPAVTTNSLGTSYNVYGPEGVIFLPSGQQFTTQTSNLGELKLGTIEIPDPGYPYVVFPIAYVQGWSEASPSGSNLSGNGNVGALTVTPVGQTTPVYAAGLCTDDTVANFYSCIPAAVTTGPVTPLTNPPIVGSITLELSACNWTGTDYTFTGTGMVFYVIVVPGLNGV